MKAQIRAKTRNRGRGWAEFRRPDVKNGRRGPSRGDGWRCSHSTHHMERQEEAAMLRSSLPRRAALRAASPHVSCGGCGSRQMRQRRRCTCRWRTGTPCLQAASHHRNATVFDLLLVLNVCYGGCECIYNFTCSILFQVDIFEKKNENWAFFFSECTTDGRTFTN
jgi:hypothetical protein